MALSTLFGFLGRFSLDDVPVWAVALVAGIAAFVAMVNALDIFLDAEVG
ncbi:MAG: hypothetical protein ACRYGA_07605 [Janthinobacterium lividum]